MPLSRCYPAIVALALLLATVAPVRGHGLGAECKVKGEHLEIEAYFDDDTPAGLAKIAVLDADDREVAAGRTDEQGHFRAAAPPPGRYRVVVDAGSGHRAEVKFRVGERVAPGSVVVSEGPAREEFTRFPWLNVMLGLGLIGGLVLGWRLIRSR